MPKRRKIFCALSENPINEFAMKKMQKNILKLVLITPLVLMLGACTSYDHKEYPRDSWFSDPTNVIEAEHFKKLKEPLKVSLQVNYLWEGRQIVTEPFEERPADWREHYGLWLASERYLNSTGLFKVVKEDDEKRKGTVVIDVSRELSPETKAELAERNTNKDSHPKKIVYRYDMTMEVKVLLVGKKALQAKATTEQMCIGDAESQDSDRPKYDPKRFTFSYFNNMDFHTEFVRRFYKQMLFENIKQLEQELP